MKTTQRKLWELSKRVWYLATRIRQLTDKQIAALHVIKTCEGLPRDEMESVGVAAITVTSLKKVGLVKELEDSRYVVTLAGRQLEELLFCLESDISDVLFETETLVGMFANTISLMDKRKPR